MEGLKRRFTNLVLLFLFCGMLTVPALAAGPDHLPGTASFPPTLESYHDADIQGIWPKLVGRAKAEPFNVIATVLFFLAIAHTFATSYFRGVAHRFHDEFHRLESLEDDPHEGHVHARRRDRLQYLSIAFHFLGEVEAIFGIWLIPLGIALTFTRGFQTLVSYVNSTNFTEPIFVVIIMAMAASRPVISFANGCLSRVASCGKGTPLAWWASILTIGPLLGSFITEPAAMTLCALLLGERFYSLKPSRRLSYATLGLLFVNISVGGTLTHFAAPPVVMVAGRWNWDAKYMLLNFGWKAVLGILLSTGLYLFVFRKELFALKFTPQRETVRRRPVPVWIIVAHLLFLLWTVLNSHYPTLLIFGFLLFLAFVEATGRHQSAVQVRPALLVGFFLAALVVHGGLQKWWIAPVLGSLGELPLMVGSVVLTAFNDNAAITYLASLVPSLTPELKYAVVAGAVTGGGLTVIANAPNPAGQTLLQKYFGDEGVAPASLAVAAALPTLIVGACYMLF